MSQVPWTDKQQEAIALRDKNIIVSAAAGSGKTAVLVERMKQLILRDRVSLSEMLVATFTNAAASDMKEKIVKAIWKEIGDRPEDSLFLRNQLDIIHKANINTFHSFALEVIRRYFYMVGVNPDFKICDDAEKTILQGEAMDDLFEEAFESEDPDFLSFLHTYCTTKSEKNAKEMVLELCNLMKTLPEPEKWLYESLELLNASSEMLYEKLKPFMRKDIEEGLYNAIGAFTSILELLEEKGIDSLIVKCGKDKEAVLRLLECVRSADESEISFEIKSIEFERFTVAKEEKAAYEEIRDMVEALRKKGKDSIKALQSLYFSRSFEEETDRIRRTYPAARFLAGMVMKFDKLYGERKREKNLLDFSDAEHFALTILKDERVAGEYREKFRYIFVDEYQDSNLLQETLVSLIRREDNVFMVGDVKQSIYKFRLAEPEIFMAKYEAFQKNISGRDAKIDLNTNFRCKGKIIDTVNMICEKIMPYDESSALHRGVSYEGQMDYPAELHLVETRDLEEEEDDISEVIGEMKATELEANIAASLIKKALGTEIHEQGRDGKGVVRNLQYQDMVILMRAVKSAGEKYHKILTEKGIPVYIDDSGGYFDTLEIEQFMNLLRVIDNKKQDIPLISLLHSKIMRFTLDELAEIRAEQRECPFSGALTHYETEGQSKALRDKCRRALAQIGEWRKLSFALPLDELLWKLMWETGYYLYAGALPGGVQRQANLRALIDKALGYVSMRPDGLYGFIRYVDILKKKGVQTGQVSLAGEDDDVVRIMTIHKSKGLEFPLVIVAGLGRKFQAGRESSGVSVHKDIGFGLKTPEEEKSLEKTLIQTVIEKKMRSESLDEEARILYVALTRAKDRLFLLGTVKEAAEALGRFKILDPGNRRMTTCFLDMVAPTFLKHKLQYSIHDRGEISVSEVRSGAYREQIESMLFQQEPLESDETAIWQVEKRMEYEYKNQRALSAKSKYSASELSHGKERGRYDYPLAKPQFLQGGKRLSGAEIGTAMHIFLEKLNFKEAAFAFDTCLDNGRSYLREMLQRCKEKEMLTEQEADAVNLAKAEDFLRSEVGLRAAAAPTVFKESPFSMEKEVGGITTIIQGVIDCYFEENGAYVLLDYKTDYTTGDDDSIERIRERYAEQIALYSEALALIQGVTVKERHLFLLSAGFSIRM